MYGSQRRRLAAGLVFEKRRARLLNLFKEDGFVGLTDLSFVMVDLRPLLIKDIPLIASMSRQPGSKPHVVRSSFVCKSIVKSIQKPFAAMLCQDIYSLIIADKSKLNYCLILGNIARYYF